MIDKILLTLDARGMNQSELEALAGLPPSRISRWKAGTGEPTASQTGRIARALNVSVEYLVFDDIGTTEEDHSEEVAKILWLAEKLGYEMAIRRLIDATVITSPVPTIEERKKERLPQDRNPNGSRKSGA